MAQGSTSVGALLGAAAGAVVGAAVLATVVTVDQAVNYQVSSATHATSATAVAPRVAVRRSYMGIQEPATQSSYQNHSETTSSQTPIHSYAFVAFAAVAGAINGLLLVKNRVSLAASTGRREALLAGIAATGMAAAPAFAAYGDPANVFGKPKDTDQFFTAKGDGWSVQLPGKYNRSKETENIPGLVQRWEDNFDAVNVSYVVVRPCSGLGSIDEARQNIVTPLLGKQAIEAESISEGGFAPGRFSSAAVLDQKEETKDGSVFYTYEILTRTADGNEGGRHQIFTMTCKNGKLYLYKAQAGDKRWFKGLERQLRTSLASFKIA